MCDHLSKEKYRNSQVKKNSSSSVSSTTTPNSNGMGNQIRLAMLRANNNNTGQNPSHNNKLSQQQKPLGNGERLPMLRANNNNNTGQNPSHNNKLSQQQSMLSSELKQEKQNKNLQNSNQQTIDEMFAELESRFDVPEEYLKRAIKNVGNKNNYLHQEGFEKAISDQIKIFLSEKQKIPFKMSSKEVLFGEGKYDGFDEKDYAKKFPKAVERHLENLRKHESRPLAKQPPLNDENQKITLYHGSDNEIKNEISPASPKFRDKNKVDPSRDGFVSVSKIPEGATLGKYLYIIELTPEEFKNMKFRGYEGSNELRTRHTLPITSTVTLKTSDTQSEKSPIIESTTQDNQKKQK